MTIPQLIECLASTPPTEGERMLRLKCAEAAMTCLDIYTGDEGKLYFVGITNVYLLVLIGNASAPGAMLVHEKKQQLKDLCKRLEIPLNRIFTMIISKSEPKIQPAPNTIDYIICDEKK